MPAKNKDLHGSVPDNSRVALLLVDVINDLEFAGGDELATNALPAARNLARLIRRARRAKVPIIYANDNFGKWRSDFRRLVAHATGTDVRGRPIARLLKPRHDDYQVLKAKHSAFFHSQLDLILDYLGAKTIVLAGFSTDSCVLFTAADAYMRDFKVIVPLDCVAACSVADHETALAQMERLLEVKTPSSKDIDWRKLRGRRSRN
ncbi:MAG TPA: isochorismatase family cysteine hydrolase [Gemmatimonadaceae bacterium]|jgi:nicotinamidase-related amidase